MDIVSGQLRNRVELTKAKTAGLGAQGIGGMINLVTQTAFDFAEPFVLSANAQVGYQTLNEKYPIRGDESAGCRFGGDEHFGILIGGRYSKLDFQSFGISPAGCTHFPGDRMRAVWGTGGSVR